MLAPGNIANLLLLIIVVLILYSYFLQEGFFRAQTVEETQADRVKSELDLIKNSPRYKAANASFLDPDRPVVVGEIP